VKLKRSGLTACALGLVALLWLIFERGSGAQSRALDTAEFYLVTYPLDALFMTIFWAKFGTEAFWAKYELLFSPLCFIIYYLVGCGVGWVMGYDRQSGASESAHPPDKG
jgi:hypothetical protein